jgi:RHS repeat-associated protein
MRKYYYSGGQRLAMRTGTADPVWTFSDHLGSTSKIASSSGTVSYTALYKAWGETRYTSGTAPTTFKYTGQREEASFGLYYYGARWYDPALGRFVQADTVTPNGVQGLDRYAYTNNNPVNFNDPSGHDVGCTQYRTADECLDSSGYGLSTAFDIYRFEKYGVEYSSWLSEQYEKYPILRTLDELAFQEYGSAFGIYEKPSLRGVDLGIITFIGGGSSLSQDLFRFGYSPVGPNPGIKPPNSLDFGIDPELLSTDTMVGPETPPLPNGLSTYSDAIRSGLTGHYYGIPEGTQLPEGLNYVPDGLDVVPSSINPPTHNTIYPITEMPFLEFVEKIMNLPWTYIGRIR